MYSPDGVSAILAREFETDNYFLMVSHFFFVGHFSFNGLTFFESETYLTRVNITCKNSVCSRGDCICT